MAERGFDGGTTLSLVPVSVPPNILEVVGELVESDFRSEVKKARGVGRGR